MPRLVSVGSVIVDIVMRIDRIPDLGGDIIASGSEITAGGGLNTMVAARRDGLDVLFAGQFGTGPFGGIVRDALAESEIEVLQSGLADQDSGYCVALVDASAERTFITQVGAEGRLCRADLDRIEIRHDDIVFVSGYALAAPMKADELLGWLATLPQAVRVVFDPSPLVDTLPAAMLEAALGRATIVSANSREARLLVPDATSLAEAAEVLANRVSGAAVVRDGGAGCWVVEAPQTPAVVVPGFEVTARDTSGAGDAHGGVLAAALARGDGLVAAARRANAAAALAVTKLGPATAPTGAEIDEFLSGR